MFQSAAGTTVTGRTSITSARSPATRRPEESDQLRREPHNQTLWDLGAYRHQMHVARGPCARAQRRPGRDPARSGHSVRARRFGHPALQVGRTATRTTRCFNAARLDALRHQVGPGAADCRQERAELADPGGQVPDRAATRHGGSAARVRPHARHAGDPQELQAVPAR